MMNKLLAIVWAAFLVAASVAAPARACPMCGEFVASSTEAEETDHFPAAVNRTIYFMLGVPSSAFFIFGFLIWRGLVKNDAYRQTMRDKDEQPRNLDAEDQSEPEA